MRVLALVLILSGCNDSKYHFSSTPKGYQLSWQNVGAIPALFTGAEIGAIFDSAVEVDAVAHLGKYGISPEMVKAIARGCEVVGFDAARFKASSSPTGWASGAQIGTRICVAFWSRARGDVVPPDAPSWTVYSWPERPSPAFDWGVPPYFPALGHEIGHAIYGARFEHGWTPPLVSGYERVNSPPDFSGQCAYLTGELE